MEIRTSSFEAGGVIPERLAFAKHHPEDRVTFAGNANPHLEWWDVPEGAKSFVVVCHDYDVPSVGDDVNQPDREIPADLPRVDFFHWVLVDIPADVTRIEEGQVAEGVVVGGRDREAALGRHGVNDFTGWFAGDDDMAGDYWGYDGPAPPWNDSIVHHYVFTVYALDLERLDVEEDFTGHGVRAAMAGHILAEASIEGTYTQNPRLL